MYVFSPVMCIQIPSPSFLWCGCSQAALALFFTSLYSLRAFPFCSVHERLLSDAPPPVILKILQVFVAFLHIFFSKSFNVVATLVCQLSKPEAKTLLQRSQLPALTTPPPPHLSVFLCLMPSASPFRCLLYLSNLWFDAPSEWSMPM